MVTSETLDQEVNRLKSALSWIEDTPYGDKMILQGEVALENIIDYIKRLELEVSKL